MNRVAAVLELAGMFLVAFAAGLFNVALGLAVLGVVLVVVGASLEEG